MLEPLSKGSHIINFGGASGTDFSVDVTDRITVPEPATFALVGIGTAALLGCGWRRRRQETSAS
jgi:PEP-CTERM motif